MVKAQRDCVSVSVAEKLRWFKAAAWDGELSYQSRLALKELLEHSLQEEIRIQLGVEPYERGSYRRDRRNGYYTRHLDTPSGPVRELKVPRSRGGQYQPEVFRRYQRRTAAVDEAILNMFLRGVSTREVGDLLEALVGVGVSAATVSSLARVLDERVAAFHQRPLEDRYQYLLFDAIVLRAKTATGPAKVVVLVAYGISRAGQRELIDFMQAPSESEAHWSRFLNSLYQRGLRGAALQLITTDGAPGLLAALQWVYPYTRHQRCWVHKLRNVSNRLRHRHRQPCLAQAKGIYLAPTRREALARFRDWKAAWEPLEPRAVACLERDLEALLTCFELPPEHRSRVRTTNPIERAFREIRRRTRPISCFNNPASVDRIIFAVLTHNNAKWTLRPLKHFTQNS